MQVFDYTEKLKEIKHTAEEAKNVFNKEELEKQFKVFEFQQSDPEFYADQVNAKNISRKKKAIEKVLNNIECCDKKIADIEAYTELIAESTDEAECENYKKEFKKLEVFVEDFWLSSLLSSELDKSSAILVIHAGAGGEDAQDWAEMLLRMYIKYAEKNDWDVTCLDSNPVEGAGVKAETYLIEGENAYGYLKTEKGVHRLVRISPFDSNERRHTSFASVEVSPYIEEEEKIEIKDEDIKIDTYKSSGAGGQHVNKTESAIRITHIPTGIIVECQNERSQMQNKETAMKMLYGKLAAKAEEEAQAKKLAELGEKAPNEWGGQMRSYVQFPYYMVKDHRTGFETSDVDSVLDGEIDDFIYEYLKMINKNPISGNVNTYIDVGIDGVDDGDNNE